ncbi:alpha/beta hydrolase [Branchiibius sp. NY16-3462-2]|uniref:alpha/beta hydrolase n=1 Tax=Branchiibius sp. NY16-3462-2 TaxID=1807500 RepID=UPI00079C6D10|nr:alpha/beta hydrolase [Branchiibius sp. NY16-3462-2]KYH46286.1 hypothetical protein AZH51_11795 [Branchiibius sp. NY16-3462-2]
MAGLPVQTDRGLEHVRRVVADRPRATVVCIHGNCSSSYFFQSFLKSLPADLDGLAIDLRGFGDSQTRPVDATRGMRDFADDVSAVLNALAPTGPLVAVAHSAGAGVVLQLALDRPGLFAGLVLEAPLSPYGFGATRDAQGTPTTPDFAGSGAGAVNPAFVAAIESGDTSDGPVSPRTVLRTTYVAAGFAVPDEDALVDSILTTRTGDGNYPGDAATSQHWPHTAPGRSGMANAMSPRWFDVSAFADIEPQPVVTWVRGDVDVIVSDQSALDFGTLGRMGVIPGWPGEEEFPSQPMVAQTRSVLDRFASRGGQYQEIVLPGVGHSPHLEAPDAFLAAVLDTVPQRAVQR